MVGNTSGVGDTMHTLLSDDGRELLAGVRCARSSKTRGRGLLGRTSLESGEGLVLPIAGPAIPVLSLVTKSVHMFFMRMPLDIVFCDADLRVLRVVANLRPWRAASCARARYAIEIEAGSAARLGIGAGDALRLEPPL
jgi:uncharacterized protein